MLVLGPGIWVDCYYWMMGKPASFIFSSGGNTLYGRSQRSETALVKCCDVKYTRVTKRQLTYRTFLHLGFFMPHPVTLHPAGIRFLISITVGYFFLFWNFILMESQIIYFFHIWFPSHSSFMFICHSFFLYCWAVFCCMNGPNPVTHPSGAECSDCFHLLSVMHIKLLKWVLSLSYSSLFVFELDC